MGEGPPLLPLRARFSLDLDRRELSRSPRRQRFSHTATTDDVDELANSLDALLGDADALAAARAAAFAFGQERYNWDFEQTTLISRVAASLSDCRAGKRLNMMDGG